MSREYIEFEQVKDDLYTAKKDAARLLQLAREALRDVSEIEDTREIRLAITNCEQASLWLDNSTFGFITECEW